MSARTPSRRAGQCALAAIAHPPPAPPTYVPRRFISNPLKSLAPILKPQTPPTPKQPDLSNPVLQKLLQAHRQAPTARSQAQPPKPPPGKIDPATTIFKPEYEIPGYRQGMTKDDEMRLRAEERMRIEQHTRQKNADLAAPRLDPAPARRLALQAKFVINSLRHRGRLTHDIKIARTERQSLFRSRNLPTSTKKLTKIMNQLAGKTLEEAFIQLRFHKKRAAQDVSKALEIARDRAVVERGMGLRNPVLADGTRKIDKPGEPVQIELKGGGRKIVKDPTEIYIDQAWVGKGDEWKTPEFRARGKVNMLTHRSASFSVILKEEKTRMRISDQIKKKRDNRKLWQPLPDRPVLQQRQYCLW